MPKKSDHLEGSSKKPQPVTLGLMKLEVCALTFKIGIGIHSSQKKRTLSFIPVAIFAHLHSAFQEGVNEKLLFVAIPAESQADTDRQIEAVL